VFLAARQADRLDAIARDLEVRGAKAATTYAADFDKVAEFGPMLDACEKAIGSPDRVLIAYGTLPDQAKAQEDPALVANALHTNFVSPAVLVESLAGRLKEGAAIAVITSVAGERGRQSNYVYGAAKGGLSRFLEGLRHRLASRKVRVIDVRPGFVDTPMTDGIDKKGPLWAKPERVARDIERALEGKDGPIHTPWFWAIIMAIITRVPARIFHKTKL
jgi:short-subunit dehydrogenase